MRRSLRATTIALVLSCLLAVVAVLPVAADAPTRVPLGPDNNTWTGVCSFPIHMTTIKADQTMTIRPGPDGAVVYYVTGSFKATLTNVETGYTLQLHNEGPYTYTVHKDGSTSAVVRGVHYLIPAYWDFTNGRQALTYAPGWVLTWNHLSGRSESICAALDH